MIASVRSTPISHPLNMLGNSSRTRMRPARYRTERGSHLTRNLNTFSLQEVEPQHENVTLIR
jgi:hypothetical protein